VYQTRVLMASRPFAVRLADVLGQDARGLGRRPQTRPLGQLHARLAHQRGFTHYCAWSRTGTFVVKRRTERKRLTRKLHHVRDELWRRMHAPISSQQTWLSSVLRGHYAYYGLPSNWHPLAGFCQEVRRSWYHVLRRRSQRRLTLRDFTALLARFPLPAPHLTHPRAALAV
jgi:hypothetical protein